MAMETEFRGRSHSKRRILTLEETQKIVLEQPALSAFNTSEKSKHLRDPVLWAKDRAGVELWSKQRETLEAVRDHRRVAVHSCHNTGKTFNAATAVGWWLDAHPPGDAFVITTAPTGAQVKALLWREINRVHTRGNLPGRVNLTEWYINNEMVAFGRKPSEYNSSAFQGIHAKRVLVVLDEACGIPPTFWVAAETIASNVGGHILVIGNPDSNDGDFARACSPGSGWHVIHIGYEHTPNFTGEDVSDYIKESLISPQWVEDRRHHWGEDSALFQSKVLGVFLSDSIDPWTVVPMSFVTPCRYLEIPEDENDVAEAGIDVAAGGDRTVIVERRGMRVSRIESFRSNDPMLTVGHLAECLNIWGIQRVKIDVIGVGWGLYGRLRELSSKHNITSNTTHNAEVIPVNFGEKSNFPKRFLNKRAEVWWTVGREKSRLATWDLSLLDDDMIHELTSPKYEIMDSNGKIKVEKKDDIIKRLGRSPDIADALLLAFYDGKSARTANANAVMTFRNSSLKTGSNSNSSPFAVKNIGKNVFTNT